MGGRLFDQAGQLYRLGQDCGETYGRRLLAFEIKSLSPTEYHQIEVPLKIPVSSWNRARYHHLDAQQVQFQVPSYFLQLQACNAGLASPSYVMQLGSALWLAVMDGDSKQKPHGGRTKTLNKHPNAARIVGGRSL
jgi:hypothetical protein